MLDHYKLADVISGVSYMPNKDMWFDDIPEGIRDMITVDELDPVLTFYGIPKIYKTDPKLQTILTMVHGMELRHQQVCDKYLSDRWVIYSWQFVKMYSDAEPHRLEDIKKKEQKDKENFVNFWISAEQELSETAKVLQNQDNKINLLLSAITQLINGQSSNNQSVQWNTVDTPESEFPTWPVKADKWVSKNSRRWRKPNKGKNV